MIISDWVIMKVNVPIAGLGLVLCLSCTSKSGQDDQKDAGPEIKFVEHDADKSVDVMIDGKFFTAYRWPDHVYKPILYPILTSAGTEITRGFPLKPREGERNDHMHQVGNWLNYGNVNGLDFWGNGSTGERDPQGGQIRHLGIIQISDGRGEGSMSARASWVGPSGRELLAEVTEFHVIAEDSVRIIDRITTLTATGDTVNFPDTKEGMFGMRVARQLELPSDEEVTLLDAHGNATTVKKMSNEDVSGNYRSSEGATGLGVWGTRARWMDLYGRIGEESISLVICDHPKNTGYPTYWHARGYGLFAANPFGARDFTEGKEQVNYALPAGQSLVFRYRIIISSGFHLSDSRIRSYADDFAARY